MARFTLSLITLPAVMALVLLCGRQVNGQAQSDSPPESESGRTQGSQNLDDRAGLIFSRLDKNADGKVSQDEGPPRFWQVFGPFDADDDGALDQEEFVKGMQGLRAGRGAGGPTSSGRQFNQYDKNSDGKVTKDEVDRGIWDSIVGYDTNDDRALDSEEYQQGDRKRSLKMGMERFDSQDKNGDGQLSKEESTVGLFPSFVDRYDADGDGFLSKDEFSKPVMEGRIRFSAGPRNARPGTPGMSEFMNRLFSANDADGDDKITPDEARRIVKNSFDEFDQNSDGAVDREEFNTVAPRFIRIPSSGPGPWFDAAQLSQMQDRYWPKLPRPAWQIRDDILPTEELPGEGIWLDPALANVRGTIFPVTVWFDRQFLGDGIAYARRCEEFAGQKREVLRARVVDTLKTLSEQSIQASEKRMRQLADQKHVRLVQWHWIVNGFSCYVTKEGLAGLQTVPGVKNIFLARRRLAGPVTDELHPSFFSMREKATFNPDRFKHPWYTRYLQADKTWRRLGVSGAGTLNVVMDGNFVFSPNVNGNLYRNTGETPGNGLDDDGNGLIDDYHGFNFERDDALLAGPVESDRYGGGNHGFLCAAIICSSGTENSPYEFGLAPAASWAGVIAHSHQERALEWAIEQGADTVSMSFSWPNLGEFRSHWRKMVEQAAFCGVCCVSGAGNFAREGSSSFAPIPIQMRTPEDIPQAVFAPAGVQRNLERTAFSSQGPVKWETEHYREGLVEKPDFCAFNFGLPLLKPDGTTLPTGVNGNSFAGPMADHQDSTIRPGTG
jgi:Ca2+-binding EF-hand superfamily protein